MVALKGWLRRPVFRNQPPTLKRSRMDYEDWLEASTYGTWYLDDRRWLLPTDESIGRGSFVDGPSDNPDVAISHAHWSKKYDDIRVVPVNARYRARVRARVDWPEFMDALGASTALRTGRHRNNLFVAICPFHDEKSPSFAMSIGGLFYCFGCGESGDIVQLAAIVGEMRSSAEIRGWFYQRFPIMRQPTTAAAIQHDQRWRHYLTDRRTHQNSYIDWRYPATELSGPLG